MPQIDQYVIARGRGSGCTFGKYQGHHGEEITLADARTIWNWSGRLHVVGVSQTKSTADNVRLTRASDEIIVTDCCQVIACSKVTIDSLLELGMITDAEA